MPMIRQLCQPGRPASWYTAERSLLPAATVAQVFTMLQAKSLFSYRPYWAQRFGTAPVLPCTREEMDDLGWDS